MSLASATTFRGKGAQRPFLAVPSRASLVERPWMIQEMEELSPFKLMIGAPLSPCPVETPENDWKPSSTWKGPEKVSQRILAERPSFIALGYPQ